MERHELVKLMSKPMWRSFQAAEDEALREVRQENGKLYAETEKAQIQWRKDHASEYEKVHLEHDAQMALIKRQMQALYDAQQEITDQRKKAEDELWRQCWESMQPLRDAQKERADAISKKWKELAAGVLAKYEAKVLAKKELVSN